MKRLIFMFAAVVMVANMASADLVLYLNFEEGGQAKSNGIVLDQSAYGNDGYVETGWEGYDLPQYITSHDGSQAMQFGYNDAGVEGEAWNNVAVPKTDSIAHIGQQWSMALWVKVDSTDVGTWHEYPKVFSCPNYEIDMHSSGDPASYFWPWDQAWEDWDFAMAPTSSYQGSWMHMAVTFDGTTFSQYINGDLVMTKDDFTKPFDEETWDDISDGILGNDLPYWINHPLRIGTHADGPNNGSMNGYLVGALDDVAIWGNVYLDADGVASLFDGTSNPLTVATVPEPATLLILAAGGLLLRRVRS